MTERSGGQGRGSRPAALPAADEVKPRKQVGEAFQRQLEPIRQLINEKWFIRELDRLRELAQRGTDESLQEGDSIFSQILSRVSREHPAVLAQLGPWQFLHLVGANLVGDARLLEASGVRLHKLFDDVDATPYEVTKDNVDAIRRQVKPGQIWLHVRGPRVGKLEGYLEGRLRQLGRRGGQTTIRRQGRRRLDEADCTEAARLKEQGWTCRQIGESKGWPLHLTQAGSLRCEKAERAVKRGRQLLSS